MITQYDVPGYLAQIIPVKTWQPQPGPLSLTIYQQLRQFTDYTRQVVTRHNYVQAKKCFCLADTLYSHGDPVVKNAVENVFVFSLSSFIPRDSVEKLILKSFIPATLYALYVKQVTEQ